VSEHCPTCGHAVKVVGDTTQHYEPTGCLRIEDDHQVCDEQIEDANEHAAVLERQVRALRDALADVADTVIAETELHTFGKRSYDVTLDHLHDVAVAARSALYDPVEDK
jgi:hypothetical protein